MMKQLLERIYVSFLKITILMIVGVCAFPAVFFGIDCVVQHHEYKPGFSMHYRLTGLDGGDYSQELDYFGYQVPVTTFKEDPDQDNLYVGYEDGVVMIHAMNDHRVLFQRQLINSPVVGFHFVDASITYVYYENGYRTLIESQPSTENNFLIFKTTEEPWLQPFSVSYFHQLRAISPDGHVGLVVTEDSRQQLSYHLINLLTKQVLLTLPISILESNHYDFSSDGQRFVYYNGSNRIAQAILSVEYSKAELKPNQAISVLAPPTMIRISNDLRFLIYAQAVTPLSGNVTLVSLSNHHITEVIHNIPLPSRDFIFTGTDQFKYIDPFGTLVLVYKKEDTYQHASLKSFPQSNIPYPVALEPQTLTLYSNQWIQKIVAPGQTHWFTRRGSSNTIQYQSERNTRTQIQVFSDGKTIQVVHYPSLQVIREYYPGMNECREELQIRQTPIPAFFDSDPDSILQSDYELHYPATPYQFESSSLGILYFHNQQLGIVCNSEPYHRIHRMEGAIFSVLPKDDGWYVVSTDESGMTRQLTKMDMDFNPLFNINLPPEPLLWMYNTPNQEYLYYLTTQSLYVYSLKDLETPYQLQIPSTLTENTTIQTGFLKRSNTLYLVFPMSENPHIWYVNLSEPTLWNEFEPQFHTNTVVAWIAPEDETPTPAIQILHSSNQVLLETPLEGNPLDIVQYSPEVLAVQTPSRLYFIEIETGLIIHEMEGQFENTEIESYRDDEGLVLHQPDHSYLLQFVFDEN